MGSYANELLIIRQSSQSRGRIMRNSLRGAFTPNEQKKKKKKSLGLVTTRPHRYRLLPHVDIFAVFPSLLFSFIPSFYQRRRYAEIFMNGFWLRHRFHDRRNISQ